MQRILLVDDDLAILEGLSQMILRNLPHVAVDTCSDGLQAWERLQRTDYSLMITDVMMPQLDGIGLLRRLEEAGKTPYSLVISGYDDFQLVRGALKLGAEDYFLKPIHLDDLLRAVRQLLQRPPRLAAGEAPSPSPAGMPPVYAGDTEQFFDVQLPLKNPAATMEEALEAASEAAMRLDIQLLREQLGDYLAAAQQGQLSREFMIKSLFSWYYSLMGQLPGMIRVASKYKLTEHDLTEGIKRADRFSSFISTLYETLGVYLHELKQTQDRRGIQIDRVKAYVRAHLGDSIQIAEAAELIDVHPNYLSTIFKDYTGMSFRDYLRQERIQKAVHLIRDTDLKLYEIAERVGYQDPAHFSRAFKQVTGETPQSMIRRNKP